MEGDIHDLQRNLKKQLRINKREEASSFGNNTVGRTIRQREKADLAEILAKFIEKERERDREKLMSFNERERERE